MHYCIICGFENPSFLEVVRHTLRLHGGEIPQPWREICEEWLRRSWSCLDCIHCGVIYDSSPEDPEAALKTACPPGRLFSHPDPANGCPNFMPRSGGE